MEEISWGGLLVTVLLPLLAVIWMVYVLRRQALASSTVAEPYSPATKAAIWVAGFVITWAFATFLGLYLLAQVGLEGTTETSTALTFLTGFVTPYVSGLWGALIPYRMMARVGKTGLSGWLLAALVYAVAFYLTTLFFS